MLKKMRYVYTVYEEKSFSKAAERLFVSLSLCKQVAKILQVKSKNKGLKNIPFTSTGKGV